MSKKKSDLVDVLLDKSDISGMAIDLYTILYS